MPRQRNPAREKAKELYLKAKGKIKLKDIAIELKVSAIQIRVWKMQDNWDNKCNDNVTNLNDNVANPNNNVTNKKIEKTIEIVNDKLTEKQKLFCSYFIKYRNKTKAYKKAFDCSQVNAEANSYMLWKNMEIRAVIDQGLKEYRDNIRIDAQDITQKYADIAFADITDFIKFGKDKSSFKISSGIDGTLVSEVKQSKDGVSIKLHDKIKALEWLGNHIQLLDTATKIKFDLEKQKLELEKSRKDLGGDSKGNIGALLDAIHRSGDDK